MKRKVLFVGLLALALALTGCTQALQQSWSSLTPDQQARIIIGGMQKDLNAKFDAGKAIVALSPQYKPVWQKSIIPAFDVANKNLGALTTLVSGKGLTPEQVYLKMKPLIDDVLLKLLEIGLKPTT